MNRLRPSRLAPALAALPLVACGTLDSLGAGGGVSEARVLSVPEGRQVPLEEVARDLARFDVVFLGELHDSLEGHVLMTELTALILDGHPAPVLSMEMFERDVQDLATLYVDGYVDRESFLAQARPWDSEASPYDDHYGPVVDLARERGWDLIAANVPRRDAAAIARGQDDPARPPIFGTTRLDLSDGRYRREFEDTMRAMMGGHGGAEMDLSRIYRAQVLKDETMAESIARTFAPDSGRWPRVVHWNGRFHSDWGLGTVERLLRRLPSLRVAVVTMERGDAVALARSDDPPGRWVIQVP